MIKTTTSGLYIALWVGGGGDPEPVPSKSFHKLVFLFVLLQIPVVAAVKILVSLVCASVHLFCPPSLAAPQGPRPVGPRGNDLRGHLLPLLLRAGPEDGSAGRHPRQVSRLDVPLVLGQHLRHVPILRTTHVMEDLGVGGQRVG